MSETPRCRICSADESDQTVRAPDVYGGGPEHAFWHCDQCDAVYLFPVPTPEEEDEFYRQRFETFMSSRSSGDRDWTTAERHLATNQDQVARRWRFLEPYVEPGKRLLEIGCSTGFMLDAFRDSGMDCVGIEPSERLQPFLEQRGHTVYATLAALGEAEPDARFDLIVHFFVLEHMPDPYAFFADKLGFLKNDGKIIAEVPCVTDPLTSMYDIPAFESFYWSRAHHYYYSPDSIAYVMHELNLPFELIPEQRYDLSNHMTWMMEGRPGGQAKYDDVFSRELNEIYRRDLKDHWLCDTFFLVVDLGRRDP